MVWRRSAWREARPQPAMDDGLAALASKWKSRYAFGSTWRAFTTSEDPAVDVDQPVRIHTDIDEGPSFVAFVNTPSSFIPTWTSENSFTCSHRVLCVPASVAPQAGLRT